MGFDRILIVGGIGSGKTTLAEKISNKLGIRHYELDNIAYKRRDIHEKNSPKIRDKKVKIILKRNKWIVEGFYSRAWTYPFYRKANVVVILNVDAGVAKRRVLIRYLKRKLSLRKKNHNNRFRVVLNLLKYIERYSEYFKKQRKIASNFNKRIVILTNNTEIKAFLNSLDE